MGLDTFLSRFERGMKRRLEQAYTLGQQEGFLRGYRLGVNDARRLAEIRGKTVVFPGDDPAGPSQSARGLTVIDGGAS